MDIAARLVDPNNNNPALTEIVTMSLVLDKASPKSVVESRAKIGAFFGGSILAELLDREPNPGKRSDEQRLGRWGGNIEVYATQNGDRRVVITNGYSRRNALFAVEKSVILRKIEGVWMEWKESISR
ncbi:MAG: hypothetical protein JRN62_02770 [Nitrososphaerota archaeon]|jgi:hypothetical protein|nr:hypothetical protein [Nitrososphaerota archaeon]MDG6948919.1 hypothetical protein [Nitrososphaerota archaeon]